jgi:hypothetical protein
MSFLRSPSFAAPVIVACALATGGVAGERPIARSAASPAQPSLEMVVGDYQASAQIIQIRLREDGVLTIAVPSQPVRELEPLGNYRFAQKGLTGYIIEFVRDRPERVNALMAFQPGGGFRAARMGSPDSWRPRPRTPASSTAAPALPARPALSKRRPLAFKELVFPTLIAAAYDGEFGAMPDYQSVRDYFVSIEQVFDKECYAAFLGTAEATQGYWSTEGRNVLRDQARVVANPDLAVATLNETFKRWAEGGFKADHSIANEGIRDGSLLVVLHGCESPEVIQFRRSLHRLFFSRRDVRAAPDNPGRIAALVNPELRERLGVKPPAQILATPLETLTDACIDSWRRTVLPNRAGWRPEAVMLEGTEWCRCLAARMLAAHLSDTDMAALRADFVKESGRIRDASTDQALKTACFKR